MGEQRRAGGPRAAALRVEVGRLLLVEALEEGAGVERGDERGEAVERVHGPHLTTVPSATHEEADPDCAGAAGAPSHRPRWDDRGRAVLRGGRGAPRRGGASRAPQGNTAECVPGRVRPALRGRRPLQRHARDRRGQAGTAQPLAAAGLGAPLPAGRGALLRGARRSRASRGWRLPTPRGAERIRYKPGGLFGGGSGPPLLHPFDRSGRVPRDAGGPVLDVAGRMPDDTAWYVGFDDGRTHRDVSSDALWVRCMHDPAP